MGNADEKLKAIADRVCETVWEDGVICELEADEHHIAI